MMKLMNLRAYRNEDGTLIPLEHDGLRDIPFVPKRSFLITSIPRSRARGDHAHKTCHQFIIPVNGEFLLTAEHKGQKFHRLIADPSQAFYAPPMTWVKLQQFSTDTVVLVYASHAYDTEDYITDRATFDKLQSTI